MIVFTLDLERAKYNEIYIIKKECINTNTKDIENVLILQGGGSLGAFACGVFKTFAKKKIIKFHIISGISIGAINGAIAAGSKSDNTIKDLGDFWMAIKNKNPNDRVSYIKLFVIDNIFKYDLFL